MNKIVKMVFGSSLYGTQTPDSDTDYKGVYLPSIDERILGTTENVKKFGTKPDDAYGIKNTKDDIDEEYYSLQYFMKLAVQGEMIVIDMLHATGDSILESSPIWEELHKNRSRFYSKNLVGYLGYIRKQVAIYSNKGSRLNAINDVLNVIYSAVSSFGSDIKMKGIWDKLPVNEYCSEVINPIEKRWRFYQVCGKQLSENITIKEAAFILNNLSKSYGSRANKAMANGGIDWKAISHAFRAGFQLREIYTTGDLVYPLRDCDFIRDVKMGKMNYENDGIGQKLEDILSEIEQLSKNSSFPDSIDKDWMNNFLVSQYK